MIAVYGDGETRTHDLHTASVAFSQLNYAPSIRTSILYNRLMKNGRPNLMFFQKNHIKIMSKQMETCKMMVIWEKLF